MCLYTGRQIAEYGVGRHTLWLLALLRFASRKSVPVWRHTRGTEYGGIEAHSEEFQAAIPQSGAGQGPLRSSGQGLLQTR